MQVAWKKHCSVCNMFSWEFRMIWTLWEKGTHPSLFFKRRLQGCKRCYHLLINLQINFRLVKWQDYIFFCKIWCLKRGSQCYWTRTRMESSRNRDPILCIKPERIWRVTLEWVREKKQMLGVSDAERNWLEAGLRNQFMSVISLPGTKLIHPILLLKFGISFGMRSTSKCSSSVC